MQLGRRGVSAASEMHRPPAVLVHHQHKSHHGVTTAPPSIVHSLNYLDLHRPPTTHHPPIHRSCVQRCKLRFAGAAPACPCAQLHIHPIDSLYSLMKWVAEDKTFSITTPTTVPVLLAIPSARIAGCFLGVYNPRLPTGGHECMRLH